MQRTEQPLTCLFLDVDHFKQVNDIHGHQAGDNVLQGVAERIKTQLRLSDVLGRYGGEEFSVLLIQTDACHSMQIAERIRGTIAAMPFQLDDGQELAVTISLGCATLEPCGYDGDVSSMAELLVANADQAMYRAKQTGRNRVAQSLIKGDRRRGGFA
jgi:diguanylate cyclase (GGDEF)-like protein